MGSEMCIRDRVAAGAIARKYLIEHVGITVQGALTQMGEISIDLVDWKSVDQNPFFCPDPARVPELEQMIDSMRREGDSVGALLTIVGRGIPAGLGEPVFDRLDADIAGAMMSINAVKGVEIGDGFEVVNQKGSEHRDTLTPEGFASNHAGGVLGGISTGQDVEVHMALNPTSSISVPGTTINKQNEEIDIVTKG